MAKIPRARLGRDAEEITKARRMDHAFRALGLSASERAVCLTLLDDRRPWSVQGMAEVTGLSRATVDSVLRDCERIGEVRHLDGKGWILTPLGLSFFALIFREILAISEGKFDGFSDILVEAWAAIDRTGNKRAKLIPRGNIFTPE